MSWLKKMYEPIIWHNIKWALFFVTVGVCLAIFFGLEWWNQ